MVKVLFEPKTKLTDSLTYDITAWSIPYAHGFEAIASVTKVSSSTNLLIKKSKNTIDKNAYAYISKWNSIEDAAFLGDLLTQNIIPRFSAKPFSLEGKSYQSGTLIILRNDNKETDFDVKLVKIANKHERNIQPVSSGFVDSGLDFGSSSVKPINKQKIGLLSGQATSSLSFGEIWHFFETELKYPITNLNSNYFNSIDISKYDVLIIPEGYYGSFLNTKILAKMAAFVNSGGTLIAVGNAVNAFANKKGFALKSKEVKKDSSKFNLTPYADLERKEVRNLITGAIFKSRIDNTHPLAFGYKNDYFSLKLRGDSYHYLQDGFNVAYFEKNAKNISGYAGSLAVKQVPESLLFGEEQKGRGSIVYLVDNILLRSFWNNGKLFLANAVFLLNSDTIK
jgi:hypothetical protein